MSLEPWEYYDPPLPRQRFGGEGGVVVFLRSWAGGVVVLAHRNRSDFCDLRLRCPSRTPEIARFPRQETAMMHCDLRARWKVASDLRFRAAISEPRTPSFCGISGDLAPSTRKSLAIAIVRFWCAKVVVFPCRGGGLWYSRAAGGRGALPVGIPRPLPPWFSRPPSSLLNVSQGKTKGQQLKGKIVS